MPFDNDNNVTYYPPVPLPTPFSYTVASNQCDCYGCRLNRGERMDYPPVRGWSTVPAISPEVRQVLTEARALVARGWGQGADKQLNPRYQGDLDPLYLLCARGALREVAGAGSTLEREAMARLANFTPGLGARLGDMDAEGIVVRFNDWETTRQPDVVALFDRALA